MSGSSEIKYLVTAWRHDEQMKHFATNKNPEGTHYLAGQNRFFKVLLHYFADMDYMYICC